MKKTVLTAALLVIAIVVAGCGSDDDDPVIEGQGGSVSAGAAPHNDADVVFAQNMIVHHEQAIQMSDIVIANGESGEVRALAEQIKAAQTPEIDLMRGWLREWDEESPPDGDHDAMGMNDDDTTMMTEDEMKELENTQGRDLDRMFLELMIRHHEGAIAMAEEEVADGEFVAAIDLAEQIASSQRAEIEEMKRLLATLA